MQQECSSLAMRKLQHHTTSPSLLSSPHCGCLSSFPPGTRPGPKMCRRSAATQSPAPTGAGCSTGHALQWRCTATALSRWGPWAVPPKHTEGAGKEIILCGRSLAILPQTLSLQRTLAARALLCARRGAHRSVPLVLGLHLPATAPATHPTQAYEHGAKHLTPLGRISYRGPAVDFSLALSSFVRGGQVRGHCGGLASPPTCAAAAKCRRLPWQMHAGVHLCSLPVMYPGIPCYMLSSSTSRCHQSIRWCSARQRGRPPSPP